MKIRFVTPWYGEFAGGAEFAARRLAENLVKRGVDAGVFTTCCRTPFDDWWSDFYEPGSYDVNGVPVERFPLNRRQDDSYGRLLHKVNSGELISSEDELAFMRSGINSHELISHIRRNRDFIYAFIPYLYGPSFWGVLANPSRSVLIPCLHDEPAATMSVFGEMFRKAARIAYLAEDERLLANRLYGIETVPGDVLGMGVDADISFDPGRFREKFGITDRFLIYVGRKDRGKNVVPLIEYFSEYSLNSDENLKLVFIGGGDKSLVPEGDDRFIDLSYVSEQDKFDAISASEALCNLSDNESFSFVIMEGWLTGTPAIVSSSSPVTRAHTLGCGGGFCVSGSEEFRSAVSRLLENRRLGAELGEKGRRYVMENYSWDRIIDGYLGVFGSLS